MTDKILHTFRHTPDETYTETLLQRINRLPQTAVSQPPQPTRPKNFRMAWALASLLLMFFMMAMVPGVRTRVEDVLKQIGGLTVLITEEFPRPIGEPIIVPHEIVTLDQSRELVAFEFSLPTWVPDGLERQEDVSLNDVIGGPWIQWLDANRRGRSLNLTISEAKPGVLYHVGPDSVTEITINGIPATFIQGSWSADEQRWQDDGSKGIRWQIDGIEYYLRTGNEELGGLSDEELIQVAESIHP